MASWLYVGAAGSSRLRGRLHRVWAMMRLMVARGITAGFLLDRQWHLMTDGMEGTKRSALLALATVLAQAGTSYAIIGGVALQAHRAEPRTTLDIDVAVKGLDTLPRSDLQSAGFTSRGRFPHSENWRGPDEVPVQFTEDQALVPAIERAIAIEIEGVSLRVIGRSDLLHEKLRAGADPARRRSKRLQDLADAQGLLEETPELRAGLSEAERRILNALPP